MEDRNGALGSMPASMKPANLQPNVQQQQKLDVQMQNMQPRKKMSTGKKVAWIIIIFIIIVALVQYFNAAKYSALVQVISEDRIGVNPTGNALDFGDLPRDKSAIRTVSLSSGGNTPSYIMIWKFGSISDFITMSQNNFTLPAHSNVQIQFTANIPNSAAYQYYRGNVIIFQIPKIW